MIHKGQRVDKHELKQTNTKSDTDIYFVQEHI